MSNGNEEVIERIKSLEETDKELYKLFSQMAVSIGKLATSTEILQESVAKLADMKEEINKINLSTLDKLNEAEIRLSKVETWHSGVKFIVGVIATTLIGLYFGKII